LWSDIRNTAQKLFQFNILKGNGGREILRWTTTRLRVCISSSSLPLHTIPFYPREKHYQKCHIRGWPVVVFFITLITCIRFSLSYKLKTKTTLRIHKLKLAKKIEPTKLVTTQLESQKIKQPKFKNKPIFSVFFSLIWLCILCSQLLFLDLLIHQVTIMTFHIFTLFLLYICTCNMHFVK